MIDAPGTRNRHPIDRLETEFEELRLQVIAGEIGTEGMQWRARVVARTVRRITVADAERELPPDLFATVVRSEQQTAVMLYRVVERPAKRRRVSGRRRSPRVRQAGRA